jgi:hypothetical protein
VAKRPPQRVRPSKDDRTKSRRIVEEAIRRSGYEPGFDYQRVVRWLRASRASGGAAFTWEDIAEECGVRKSAVQKWLPGPGREASIPHHDAGERLHILYFEIFKQLRGQYPVDIESKKLWTKPYTGKTKR